MGEDLTDEFIIKESEAEEIKQEEEQPPEERGNHPYLIMVDFPVTVLKNLAEKLKAEGYKITEINEMTYELGKQAVNDALWELYPEPKPDNPKLALVSGIAMVGMAVAPTGIDVVKAFKEKKQKEKEKIEHEGKNRNTSKL